MKIIPRERLIVREPRSLPFNGGEIWVMDLDALSVHGDIVREKFLRDIAVARRPSSPSEVALHLKDTEVTAELAALMARELRGCGQNVRRIAVIGCDRSGARLMGKYLSEDENAFVHSFFTDFEKAKEWLIP